MSVLIEGPVVPGARDASGLHEPQKPNATGTILLQRPFFISAGIPQAETLFIGTINIDIAPKEFRIVHPDYVVTAEWLSGVLETFWLIAATLHYGGNTYPAFLYYPCPSAIKAHPNTVVEILAPEIERLGYGESVCVELPEGKIVLR